MRKFFCFWLSAILLLCFSACSNSESSQSLSPSRITLERSHQELIEQYESTMAPSIPRIEVFMEDLSGTMQPLPYTAIVRQNDEPISEDLEGSWFMRMAYTDTTPVKVRNSNVLIRFPQKVDNIEIVDHELNKDGNNRGFSPYGSKYSEPIAEFIPQNTHRLKGDSNNELNFGLWPHVYFAEKLLIVEGLRGFQLTCSMNGQMYEYYVIFMESKLER